MRAEPLHQTRPADADVTEAIGRDAILAIVEDAGATCGGIRLARDREAVEPEFYARRPEREAGCVIRHVADHVTRQIRAFYDRVSSRDLPSHLVSGARGSPEHQRGQPTSKQRENSLSNP